MIVVVVEIDDDNDSLTTTMKDSGLVHTVLQHVVFYLLVVVPVAVVALSTMEMVNVVGRLGQHYLVVQFLLA